MIRAVATPAPVTFNRIRDMMNYVKPQFEADLASVGIEVNEKMVKGNCFEFWWTFRIKVLNINLIVPARILDCPDLRYKDGSARIYQGAWNPQIFHNTKPIEYWFAISFGTRQPERNMRDLNGLVGSLQQVCSFYIKSFFIMWLIIYFNKF